MLYRLIILNGAKKGERHSVGVGPLVIGSGPDCPFRLDAPDVAREHARVEATEQGLIIRDLGTVNRILVNRREVSESVLKHGDTVEIGPVDLLVQACLEADISGGPRLSSNRSSGGRSFVRVLLAFAAALAGFFAYRLAVQPGGQPEPAPAVPVVAAPVPVPEPVPAPEAPAPVPAPAPAPGPDPAAANVAVTEELKQLRQALADLQKTVQEKARPEPPPAAPQPSPEQAAAEAELRIAKRDMATARAALEAGRWDEAHARLDVILADRPGDVEAMTWKATAYERQGQLGKAIGMWSRMLENGGDPARARAERNRLTSETLRAQKPQPRHARLGRVQIHKFPDSGEYDEMRLLHVEVERIRPDWPDEMRLQVAFFDRSRDGSILLSQALGSKDRLELAGEPASGTLRGEVTYLVPRNGRKPGAGGGGDTYYGYLIRLWVNGQVEDEVARPISLLHSPEPVVGRPPAREGT